MKTENKEPIATCTGKFDFCWPWTDSDYTNGRQDLDTKRKGLAFMQLTNTNPKKGKFEPTRNVPFLNYGSGKVVINFCPFCGANYEELGRI